VNAHDYAAADSLISHRERALPGDAEVYVSRGNLYFQKAFGAMSDTTTGLPGAAGADHRNAPRARHAARAPRDRVACATAFAATRAARHALRAAYMLQQLGDPESEFEVLSNAVDVRDAASRFVALDLRRAAARRGRRVRAAGAARLRAVLSRARPARRRAWPMLAIARLSSEAYPRNNRSTNDVAFYYGTAGEWHRSLEFLRRAEKSDSTDALVLYNLGWTHENLGAPEPRGALLQSRRRRGRGGPA
jgi:tetratricopeptide (TPR) repeat protein